MHYQLPLFGIKKGNNSDIVYTDNMVAKDMVIFFKPSGKILEPCKGEGVFLKYLPKNAQYCEAQEGIDFYSYTKSVDWIIGNPPYSGFFKWLYHSVKIANNIVYLLPANKPFISNRLIMLLKDWGEISHMRFYGCGNHIGFKVGFAIAAFYFKKGNKKGCSFSYYNRITNRLT